MNFWYLFLAVSLVLVPAAFAQDDLEQRVEILELDVTNIKDDVEDVETDVGSLQNDVSQNTGQLFEIANDLDDTDDLNDVQEDRIGVLEEENSVLRQSLEDLQQVVNFLTTQVNSLNQNVNSLNETVSDLDIGTDNSTNERLDALESDVTTLESDVTTLESDVTTLEGGFTQLESDVTTLESDVTTLDAGFTQLESDVTNVELTVQALNTSTDQRLEALEENNADYSDTAFLATSSVLNFAPSDPIVWDSAILNPGGHYSTTLGVYTVPVDGIYQFVMHYQNYAYLGSAAWLEVDNVKVAYLYNYDANTYNHGAHLDLTLSLTSGQQVWISPDFMDGMYGTDDDGVIHSWFSGHLIYPL